MSELATATIILATLSAADDADLEDVAWAAIAVAKVRDGYSVTVFDIDSGSPAPGGSRIYHDHTPDRAFAYAFDIFEQGHSW